MNIFLVRNLRFLVLSKEELSSYVEGRALESKKSGLICRFVLEDIIPRYGCFDYLRVDQELNSKKARIVFERFHIKLKLTCAYNFKGNGKSNRGHPPIVNVLFKSCNRRFVEWPNYLPLALMADCMTCSSMTRFSPIDFMMGQKRDKRKLS